MDQSPANQSLAQANTKHQSEYFGVFAIFTDQILYFPVGSVSVKRHCQLLPNAVSLTFVGVIPTKEGSPRVPVQAALRADPSSRRDDKLVF